MQAHHHFQKPRVFSPKTDGGRGAKVQKDSLEGGQSGGKEARLILANASEPRGKIRWSEFAVRVARRG